MSQEEKLVASFLKQTEPFIKRMKKKYYNSYFGYDEIESAAMEGILFAVRKDPDCNASFVMSWIENTIKKYKKKNRWYGSKVVFRVSDLIPDSVSRDGCEKIRNDWPDFKDSTNSLAISYLESDKYITTEENHNNAALASECLEKEIGKLSQRDQFIINGLVLENKTLCEVGSALNISYERVRQIYNRLIKSLEKKVQLAIN